MTWRNVLAISLLAASCATTSAPPVIGLPRNFAVVEEGKVLRGAQPTAAEIENLSRRGVRTIVKFNANDLDMERSVTSQLGIRLIEIPLNARTVGTSRSCDGVERAYAAMTDPMNWPVYIHCEHGRDRTGFMAGLYRERVQGWTWPQVSDELARFGHDAKMRLVFPHISRSLADHVRACGGGGA
ncbi:MAG: hypothetical protein NVSMB68_10990 [Thermoanaerobaculia bacterium]